LGGKTVAYEERGAAAVFGADLLEANAAASQAYAGRVAAGRRKGGEETAENKGVTCHASFLVGDASALPFADGSFDTVVANDAMEHFARPSEALKEMARTVRKRGAVWIFFTPHFSPLGSHLYDYIYTPWCHLIFTRKQIERAIRRILLERSGGDATAVEEKLAAIMTSYDEDLNHMSVRRFLRIVKSTPGLSVTYLELRPAKYGFLRPLTRVPLLREFLTGFVVCRLESTGS
jgi:SAM-dependent methyltransferase